jgi:hypothetical protein
MHALQIIIIKKPCFKSRHGFHFCKKKKKKREGEKENITTSCFEMLTIGSWLSS